MDRTELCEHKEIMRDPEKLEISSRRASTGPVVDVFVIWDNLPVIPLSLK